MVQLSRSVERISQALVPVPTDRIDSSPDRTLDKTGGNSRVANLTTLSECDFVDVNSFRSSDPVDNLQNKETKPIHKKLTKITQ